MSEETKIIGKYCNGWLFCNVLYEALKTDEEDETDWEALGISPPKVDLSLFTKPFRFNLYSVVTYYPNDVGNACIVIGAMEYELDVLFEHFDYFFTQFLAGEYETNR